MKRTIISFLTIILIFTNLILPLFVNAQETTLKTSIPSLHTLDLGIEGRGAVIINKTQYVSSRSVTIQRHSEPTIQTRPARGYSINSVTYNQENITHLFNSGEWTMPKVESDITLSIVFVRDSGNPPTGDTFSPWIMVLFLVSIMGLIICVWNFRKGKLI